jgi:hypothetical protein
MAEIRVMIGLVNALMDVRDYVGHEGLPDAFDQAMVLLEWRDTLVRSAAEFGIDGDPPIEP